MIIGHKRQIAYFNKILAKGNYSHAYLFFGPRNVGKRTIAERIAQSFYCEKNPKSLERVCGECASCIHIHAHAHQNVFFLSRENTLVSKKETRREIPIEDIRELKRILSFAPEGNKMRIVLIDDADVLSQESANAFLKLLEEPPSQTLFFLISSDVERMLPTIRSRAENIFFSLVDRNEIEKLCSEKSLSWQKTKEVCDIADGRPGIAALYWEDRPSFEEEKQFSEEIRRELDRGLPYFFLLSERITAGDESFRRRAGEYVLRILRKRLHMEEDSAKRMSALQKAKHVSYILNQMERTNVNPRSSLDLIFLEGSVNFIT